MYSDSQKNFYTVEELKTQHKGIWDLVVKENKNFPSDDKYLICSFVEKNHRVWNMQKHSVRKKQYIFII